MGLVMHELSLPPALRGHFTRAVEFEERTPGPLVRREAPLLGAVLIVVSGPPIDVDGRRVGSFAGGLYDRPVVTGHGGEQTGLEVTLTATAAWRLFGVPMHEFTNRVVDLEDLLPREFAEMADWDALSAALARRLSDAAPGRPEVDYVLGRIEASHGLVRVEALAAEVGWSRRHLAAMFRREIGLGPKAVARLARAERAATLLRAPGASAADVAYACGYADQPHFTREFRAFAGVTPGQFPNVQDAAAAA